MDREIPQQEIQKNRNKTWWYAGLAVVVLLVTAGLMRRVLDISDVHLTSTLESLGIDSLGLVESIFAIEEAFDISVPFNAALKGDNRSLVDAQIAIEKIPLGSAEATLRLWGKNITNGHDFVRGVDFGPLGFAGGYFADPATYGVTVGVKF